MATTEKPDEAGYAPLSVVDPGPRRNLLQAALDCFSAQGFHATTTREIAQRAGLSPAAVYVHYPSKAELLYRLSSIAHEDVLAVVQRAVEFETDPVERVRAYIVAF